jgi:hypothetical protein
MQGHLNTGLIGIHQQHRKYPPLDVPPRDSSHQGIHPGGVSSSSPIGAPSLPAFVPHSPSWNSRSLVNTPREFTSGQNCVWKLSYCSLSNPEECPDMSEIMDSVTDLNAFMRHAGSDGSELIYQVQSATHSRTSSIPKSSITCVARFAAEPTNSSLLHAHVLTSCGYHACPTQVQPRDGSRIGAVPYTVWTVQIRSVKLWDLGSYGLASHNNPYTAVKNGVGGWSVISITLDSAFFNLSLTSVPLLLSCLTR